MKGFDLIKILQKHSGKDVFVYNQVVGKEIKMDIIDIDIDYKNNIIIIDGQRKIKGE